MERTDAFTRETRAMLEDEILKFPVEKMQDPDGGFFGQMKDDGTLDENEPREVVLNARILWTYAASYRLLKKKEYLMTATRTKDFFVEHFVDHKYGGVYWSLNPDGSRLDTGKRFRAIGAAIYGLSEYVLATGDESVMSYAVNLFETAEKEGFDPVTGLYRDMKSREWGDAEPQKCEVFCTHLNILEGYTNLYKVWKEERLHSRIIYLLSVFTDNLLADSAASQGYSCKHIVEASWQMLKAAFAVKDIYVIDKVRPLVQQLLARASEGDCGTQACEIAEKIVAELWSWKYLNDTGAAEKALECWNSLKTGEVDRKCSNCMFRMARMCVEVSEMF